MKTFLQPLSHIVLYCVIKTKLYLSMTFIYKT